MSALSDEQIYSVLRSNPGFADPSWVINFARAIADAAIAADRAARAKPWGFVVTAANGNQQALPEGSVLLHVARTAKAPMFPLYAAPAPSQDNGGKA